MTDQEFVSLLWTCKKKCGEIFKWIYIYIYIVSHDRNIQWNPARKLLSMTRCRGVDDPRLFTYLRSSTWRNSKRHMFCYSWRSWQCNSVPMKTSCKVVKCKLIECVYLLPHLLTLHCVTKRKDACSITDSVIGLFHWHNLSGSNMALRLTQPSTEMNSSNFFFWGGGGMLPVRRAANVITFMCLLSLNLAASAFWNSLDLK
jgi:hypothetical protein